MDYIESNSDIKSNLEKPSNSTEDINKKSVILELIIKNSVQKLEGRYAEIKDFINCENMKIADILEKVAEKSIEIESYLKDLKKRLIRCEKCFDDFSEKQIKKKKRKLKRLSKEK